MGHATNSIKKNKKNRIFKNPYINIQTYIHTYVQDECKFTTALLLNPILLKFRPALKRSIVINNFYVGLLVFAFFSGFGKVCFKTSFVYRSVWWLSEDFCVCAQRYERIRILHYSLIKHVLKERATFCLPNCVVKYNFAEHFYAARKRLIRECKLKWNRNTHWSLVTVFHTAAAEF